MVWNKDINSVSWLPPTSTPAIRPLTGDDIAEVVYFAAAVPEHIQVAEVLVMPTNQATGTIVSRK